MKKRSAPPKAPGSNEKKPIWLTVSDHIDNNFREYALYTLESRGIPHFYDGLTNVQKMILINAPTNFNKTIKLVGDCISDGYAHGNLSLESAISKLAKPFNVAEQLLEGDGFFGTPVNEDAAAARYTSVKINPNIKKIISKYSHFTKKNEDGVYDKISMDIPVGLSTTIIGIGVGYKATILPRSLEDIRKFLDGKIKKINPKFKNFNGKIEKYQNFDKTWLLSGVTERHDLDRKIYIKELPPLMKYSSFLKKMERIMEDYPNVRIHNYSSDTVNICLYYKGAKDGEWVSFCEKVEKQTKLLITETIVFIKDRAVLQYDSIEQYLTDYKWHVAKLDWENTLYELRTKTSELEFQEAKLKFLEFISDNPKMEESKVNRFLSKYDERIKSRLESITLKRMNLTEIENTKSKINEMKDDIIKHTLDERIKFDIYNSLEDPTKSRASNTKRNKVDLFDDTLLADEIEKFTLEETIEVENF